MDQKQDITILNMILFHRETAIIQYSLDLGLFATLSNLLYELFRANSDFLTDFENISHKIIASSEFLFSLSQIDSY